MRIDTDSSIASVSPGRSLLGSVNLLSCCLPLQSVFQQNIALNVSLARCIMPADFKQALGQQSSKGPAPPCKLTAHQTQIVKALIEAHADDVEVRLTLLSFTISVASKQSVYLKHALQRFQHHLCACCIAFHDSALHQ